MITLTQAFKLCNVRDDEVVFLQKRADQPDFGCWGYALSGIKTRQKYDMKHIIIAKKSPFLHPYRSCELDYMTRTVRKFGRFVTSIWFRAWRTASRWPGRCHRSHRPAYRSLLPFVHTAQILEGFPGHCPWRLVLHPGHALQLALRIPDDLPHSLKTLFSFY